jgi:MFS family permease
VPPRLSWGALDRRLQALIAAMACLALATTPEIFLVLWAQSRGLEVVWVPLLWAAASAAKVLIAIPGGHFSDRFGRLRVLVAGWAVRVLVLLTLGFSAGHGLVVWILFLAYVASLAFTEGAERALIGDYALPQQRATAFGLYHMSAGLMALPGAVLFGALWQSFDQSVAFLSAAGLTALSVAILIGIARKSRSG